MAGLCSVSVRPENSAGATPAVRSVIARGPVGQRMAELLGFSVLSSGRVVRTFRAVRSITPSCPVGQRLAILFRFVRPVAFGHPVGGSKRFPRASWWPGCSACQFGRSAGPVSSAGRSGLLAYQSLQKVPRASGWPGCSAAQLSRSVGPVSSVGRPGQLGLSPGQTGWLVGGRPIGSFGAAPAVQLGGRMARPVGSAGRVGRRGTGRPLVANLALARSFGRSLEGTQGGQGSQGDQGGQGNQGGGMASGGQGRSGGVHRGVTGGITCRGVHRGVPVGGSMVR